MRLTSSCSVCEWPSHRCTHLCAHSCYSGSERVKKVYSSVGVCGELTPHPRGVRLLIDEVGLNLRCGRSDQQSKPLTLSSRLTGEKQIPLLKLLSVKMWCSLTKCSSNSFVFTLPLWSKRSNGQIHFPHLVLSFSGRSTAAVTAFPESSRNQNTKTNYSLLFPGTENGITAAKYKMRDLGN